MQLWDQLPTNDDFACMENYVGKIAAHDVAQYCGFADMSFRRVFCLKGWYCINTFDWEHAIAIVHRLIKTTRHTLLLDSFIAFSREPDIAFILQGNRIQALVLNSSKHRVHIIEKST